MTQTYIKDLSKHVGEEVTLKGWLYNMRSSGSFCFRICATALASCKAS